jgi:DNA repair protein RAD5
MLASLIHTNREGEAEPDSKADSNDQEGEPVAKRPKFRQITLSKQWTPIQKQQQTSPEVQKPPHATLVVCPVSLAKQWQEELGRMSVEGSLITKLWYGNERGDLDVLLSGEKEERVDVVITSYGTLASEHSKWMKNREKSNYEGGGLFDGTHKISDCLSCGQTWYPLYVTVAWLRIVLGRNRWSQKLKQALTFRFD